MTASAHVPWQDCDIEALWHSSQFRLLGRWHQGACALTVMLAQPSSAPVERVFSMLKTVVSDQQCRGLALVADYQTEPMMLYYNACERARPA